MSIEAKREGDKLSLTFGSVLDVDVCVEPDDAKRDEQGNRLLKIEAKIAGFTFRTHVTSRAARELARLLLDGTNGCDTCTPTEGGAT